MSILQQSLTVVTCGKGNLGEVRATLNSFKKFQNGCPKILLVLSDFSEYEIRQLEVEFSELVLSIYQVPAEGVYRAMNYALGQIRTGHVLFLNSGDLIASESALNSLFLGCQPDRWGYGGAIISNETSTLRREYRFHPYIRIFHLLGLKYVPHPSSIVPINLLTKFGGFDLKYPVAADQKILLQCSLVSKPFVMRMPISNFKLGGISTRTPLEIVQDFKSISRDLLPRWHLFNLPLINPWKAVLLVRKLKRSSL